MRLRSPTCLVLCMVLASCSSQPQRPKAPPTPSERPAPVPVTAISPAEYVAEAASIDLLALKSSELALQRSLSPRIRHFAETMRSLHQGTSAQLAFAGRRLDLTPSPTLLPADQVSLGQLQHASSFDQAYARQQKTLHRRALQLHAAYQAHGTSPTLRTVATFVTGRLREHQGAVDAL